MITDIADLERGVLDQLTLHRQVKCLHVGRGKVAWDISRLCSQGGEVLGGGEVGLIPRLRGAETRCRVFGERCA